MNVLPGRRVVVSGFPGVVGFVGFVHFGRDRVQWVGIELDDKKAEQFYEQHEWFGLRRTLVGQYSGRIAGQTYWRPCREGHGVFVPRLSGPLITVQPRQPRTPSYVSHGRIHDHDTKKKHSAVRREDEVATDVQPAVLDLKRLDQAAEVSVDAAPGTTANNDGPSKSTSATPRPLPVYHRMFPCFGGKSTQAKEENEGASPAKGMPPMSPRLHAMAGGGSVVGSDILPPSRAGLKEGGGLDHVFFVEVHDVERRRWPGGSKEYCVTVPNMGNAACAVWNAKSLALEVAVLRERLQSVLVVVPIREVQLTLGESGKDGRILTFVCPTVAEAQLLGSLLELRTAVAGVTPTEEDPKTNSGMVAVKKTLNEQRRSSKVLEDPDRYSAKILKAVERKNLARIADYVGRGANVNHINPVDGWRPLHLAAFLGHADVVDLLLELKADPDATEANGKSALDLALEENRRACAALVSTASKRLETEKRSVRPEGANGQGNSSKSCPVTTDSELHILAKKVCGAQGEVASILSGTPEVSKDELEDLKVLIETIRANELEVDRLYSLKNGFNASTPPATTRLGGPPPAAIALKGGTASSLVPTTAVVTTAPSAGLTGPPVAKERRRRRTQNRARRKHHRRHTDNSSVAQDRVVKNAVMPAHSTVAATPTPATSNVERTGQEASSVSTADIPAPSSTVFVFGGDSKSSAQIQPLPIPQPALSRSNHVSSSVPTSPRQSVDEKAMHLSSSAPFVRGEDKGARGNASATRCGVQLRPSASSPAPTGR